MKDNALGSDQADALKEEVQAVIKRWERMGYDTPAICENDREIENEAALNLQERADFVKKGILPEDYKPSEYSQQPLQFGRFNLIGANSFEGDHETNFDTFEEAVKALTDHPNKITHSMGVSFDDGVNKRSLIESEWHNDGSNHSFRFASDYIAEAHAASAGDGRSERGTARAGVLPPKLTVVDADDDPSLGDVEPPDDLDAREASRHLPPKTKAVLPPKLTVVDADDDPSLEDVAPPDDLNLGEDEDLDAVLGTGKPSGARITRPKPARQAAGRTSLPDDDAVIEDYPDIGEGGWIEASHAPVAVPSQTVANPVDDPYGLPDAIEDRYLVKKGSHKQELFLRNEKLPAIVDRGSSLRALGSDTATIRDVVDIAIHREWPLLKLRGSKQFRQEAWIEATARGLKVEGYTPGEVDIQEAIKRGSTFGEQVAERGGPEKGPTVQDDLENAMSSNEPTVLGERHVPAKPTDNWFDLGPHGAKLERLPVSEESGEYYLRLEINADKFIPDLSEVQFREAVQEDGWVSAKEPASDGKVAIETYQSAQSAREIARKVSVWFDHETMKNAHKPLRDHTDPPRVFGLVRANTQAELAQLVAGVDLGDKTRIQNTMALCMSMSDQMREKAEKSLFSGNGNRVFIHLTERLMNRVENPWPELEAASYTRGLMEAAGRNPNDQTAQMMSELGQLLRDEENDAVSAMTDGILRDTEGYTGDDAVAHPAMNEAVYARVARDVRFAQRAGNDIAPKDIALGQITGASYLPAGAMSGTTEINRTNAAEVLQEAKAKLPFDVRADGSTPTTQVAESVVAMEQALSSSATAFGRSPESLLRGAEGLTVRLSNDNVSADADVVGYHLHVGDGDEKAKAQAIANSARSGRSFVHELGHAVSKSWGFTEAEKEACLMKSGALAKMHDEIDARYPTDDVESRGYYRDPEEMFARMFDAHVCNVARDNGDLSLESIGGAHTTTGYDKGVPHGNIAATSAFADEVSATIERKLVAENALQQEQTKDNQKTQSAGPSR